MIFPQVSDGDPDQVFLSVTNNSATTLTKGRCVVFDYGSVTNTTATTVNNGNHVRLPTTTATQLDNPIHFAGVVARKDIPPYASGSVQAWGYCDLIHMTGYTTNGTTVFTVQTATIDHLRNLILRPFDGLVAAASTPGLMVALLNSHTAASAADMTYRHLLNGGYAGMANFNTATTATYTSSVSVKAHLRFL